jgi:hypothetical protein
LTLWYFFWKYRYITNIFLYFYWLIWYIWEWILVSLKYQYRLFVYQLLLNNSWLKRKWKATQNHCDSLLTAFYNDNPEITIFFSIFFDIVISRTDCTNTQILCSWSSWKCRCRYIVFTVLTLFIELHILVLKDKKWKSYPPASLNCKNSYDNSRNQNQLLLLKDTLNNICQCITKSFAPFSQQCSWNIWWDLPLLICPSSSQTDRNSITFT